MKINKLLLTLTLVWITSVSFAQATSANSTSISSEPTDHLTQMYSSNGINVNGKLVRENNATYLELIFENNSLERVEFIWSVLKNGERLVLTEDDMTEVSTSLNPTNTIDVGDTVIIPVAEGESTEDFSVQIKLN